MAKTIITNRYNDKNIHAFQTSEPSVDTILVSSFENGIATLKTTCGCILEELVDTVVGCFTDGSNFGDEVITAFDCEENDTFTGIKFTFNGVTLTVTKENADRDRICKEWEAGIEANAEKYRRMYATCM